MKSYTSKLITFGRSSTDNIYTDPTQINEYNIGFTAGTIINCRSINTALKSESLITKAFLASIGGVDEEYTFTLIDDDMTSSTATSVTNISSITYAGMTAESVRQTIFSALRQFRTINSNSSDKILCHDDLKNVNLTNLAITSSGYNATNYKAHYTYADNCFIHKNATGASGENFKGSITFKNYTNYASSSNGGSITFNPNLLAMGGNTSYNDTLSTDAINGFNLSLGYSALNFEVDSTSCGYNNIAIGRSNLIKGLVSSSQDEDLDVNVSAHDNVLIGVDNTLCDTGQQLKINNSILVGRGLYTNSTNMALFGQYNGISFKYPPTVIFGSGTADTKRCTALTMDVNGICEAKGNISITFDNNQPTIGLGTSDNNWKVVAHGDITANSYDATSDIRLKTNIKDYKCDKSILDLPVKEFDYIKGGHHIGCIAQDLQKICPEIVHENDEGYLTIEESKLVYLLLDEVKSLKHKIDELEKKLG